MNRKLFIILFVLLVLFEKTNGCHPSGSGGQGTNCQNNNDFEIIDVEWLPNSQLSVTINNTNPFITESGEVSPVYMVHAIGHYTFSGIKAHYRFLQNPVFVNTHHCAHTKGEVNPFTYTHDYDQAQTPALNEYVQIRLSVYWFCYDQYESHVLCCSKPLITNSYYTPSKA